MTPALQQWIYNIQVYSFDIYNYAIVIGIVLLFIQLSKNFTQKKLTKKIVTETVASLFAQIPYYISRLLFYGSIVLFLFAIYEFSLFKLPINWWTFALTLLIADLLYYFEHRLAHRIRFLWAAHSVHHSSQVMNASSAFRFSVITPLISAVLYVPLVLLGVHPVLAIAAEIIVQAYQFLVHNELVPYLGPIEYVMNTPSNHRVHHDRTIKYRDKNYGGILIIWDRIFGTYQKEDKKIQYGLPEQIDSQNPMELQFHELRNIAQDVVAAKTIGEKIKVLIMPPTWLKKRVKIFDDTKK